MMCQSPNSIVNRQNPLPRWVIWAFFIVLGCLANHSHAQGCTQNQTLSNATSLNSSYLISSSARNRTIFSAEGIFVLDCTGFSAQMPIPNIKLFLIPTMLAQKPTLSSSSPIAAKTTFVINCQFNFICFDATGNAVVDAEDPDPGINGTLDIFISGVDSTGKQCFSSGQLLLTNLNPGVLLTSGGTTTSSCVRFIVKALLTLTQTKALTLKNIASIKLKSPQGAVLQFSIEETPSSLDIARAPVTLNVQNGTCAVKLSNTLLSFGVLKTSQINALANGGVAKTLPFSLDIGNCIGTSLGKNKMLRWIFDDPRLGDFTQMDNSPFGSAKGISAQIIADAKFDSSGNAMASNIITNGERYMASGKSADVQTLSYKVNIIRNTDAVVEGAFSSNATVVLDYQ